MNRSILGAIASVLFTLTPVVTSAQDAAPPAVVPDVSLPPVGETLALEQSDRAPWAGMLVRDDDLFALQSSVMTLQLSLRNTRDLLAQALAGRDHLLEEAGHLCDERVELHTTLWTARAAELTQALEHARAERGAQWYEILGYALVGLAVGALIALPVGFALAH